MEVEREANLEARLLSAQAREAQRPWGARPVQERLRVLRRARGLMAEMAGEFAAAIPPKLARIRADTLVAELLPLLEACRFLERQGARILATRRLGRRGLPLWLGGIESEIQRVPLGLVLVIGPSNYPLFLPGVQTLQALAAGNAVVWKPGVGGGAVADLFARVLKKAGLPPGLLRVAEDTVEAARQELDAGADKVFFTGSSEVGRAVAATLAKGLTPCVMEVSGCDAVVVMPGADLKRVAQALAFGMHLNGSATCMAPRRVLMMDWALQRDELLEHLSNAFATVEGVDVGDEVRALLEELVAEAEAGGALAHYSGGHGTVMKPVVVAGVRLEMRIARTDLFAPVLSLIEVNGAQDAVRVNDACEFALTVSIFGEERAARTLAEKMTAGTVMVNDVIVPTADPRVPFGGRRASGFGVTRGAEGLLEMTAVKVLAVRRNQNFRHFEKTSEAHEPLFRALILSRHARTVAARWRGLSAMSRAAKRFKKG